MDTEEWEYRKREPMITSGPLNLRPFLNRYWFDQGGASNVCLSIGFFTYTLPFMPLGSATHLERGNDLPNYQDLLTPKRFLLRCNLVKKQSTDFLKNPLILEILLARLPGRVEKGRATTLRWREKKNNPNSLESQPIRAVEQGLYGPVMSHGGSSFGNVGRPPSSGSQRSSLTCAFLDGQSSSS